MGKQKKLNAYLRYPFCACVRLTIIVLSTHVIRDASGEGICVQIECGADIIAALFGP